MKRTLAAPLVAVSLLAAGLTACSTGSTDATDAGRLGLDGRLAERVLDGDREGVGLGRGGRGGLGPRVGGVGGAGAAGGEAGGQKGGRDQGCGDAA